MRKEVFPHAPVQGRSDQLEILHKNPTDHEQPCTENEDGRLYLPDEDTSITVEHRTDEKIIYEDELVDYPDELEPLKKRTIDQSVNEIALTADDLREISTADATKTAGQTIAVPENKIFSPEENQAGALEFLQERLAEITHQMEILSEHKFTTPAYEELAIQQARLEKFIKEVKAKKILGDERGHISTTEQSSEQIKSLQEKIAFEQKNIDEFTRQVAYRLAYLNGPKDLGLSQTMLDNYGIPANSSGLTGRLEDLRNDLTTVFGLSEKTIQRAGEQSILNLPQLLLKGKRVRKALTEFGVLTKEIYIWKQKLAEESQRLTNSYVEQKKYQDELAKFEKTQR